MEQYFVWALADTVRRERITEAERNRACRAAKAADRLYGDPLRGLLRARMMWWIAAYRLRQATFETARGAR